jgi:hypothetical protein
LRKKLGLQEFPFDMPPLNDAGLAVQSPIALQPAPRNGNHTGASEAGSAPGPASAGSVDSAGSPASAVSIDIDALAKTITESVIQALAQKYALVPRK